MTEATGSKSCIISASRRSDIPAFFSDWFMESIRAGFVDVPNPFNNQSYRVSLRSEDVHSIVFWSKDYRPLLSHLDELEQRDYRLMFHFTITGLPCALEPYVPDSDIAIETLSYLMGRYSPDHVIWRFDPIIFTDALQEDYHLQSFKALSRKLAGKVTHCYISFLDIYKKVQGRLDKLARKGQMPQELIGCFDPPLARKKALAEKLIALAEAAGIELYTCCEDELIQPGLQKGHCIDGALLARLFPDRPPISQLAPSREGCGCYESRDIGSYKTCRHGCIYCYA